MKKRGFTLIESLAVIAIIGTLATLTTFIITSVQRSARDAKRKSDITAVAEGFEARYADKTCGNGAMVGRFPGQDQLRRPTGVYEWGSITVLANDSLCNPFSEYLGTIPADPKSSQGRGYYFNLSYDDDNPSVNFKHYRLAASLERAPKSSEISELLKQSKSWTEDFNGWSYDTFTSDGDCGTQNVRDDADHRDVCYSYYQGR